MVLDAWVEVNIIFIVNMTEAENVLLRTLCSPKVEARPRELLSDLMNEDFSRKEEAVMKALLRDLNALVCSAKVEATISEAVKVLNMESFFPILDPAVNEALRDWVYATPLFRSTAIATQAELFPKHSVFVTEVLPVLSNPEVVTLEPLPAEA